MQTSDFLLGTLNNKSRRRALMMRAAAACAALLALPLAGGLLAGCGGGDDATPFNAGGGGAAVSFGGRSFAANAVTLRGSDALAGKTATLAVQTDSSNGATGTLTIDDPTRKASRVVIATPAANGTYATVTGSFSLSGSFTVNGVSYPFDISGTLPPAGGAGNISYNIAGESYSGAFTIPAGGGTTTGGTTTGGTTSGTTGGSSATGSFVGSITNNNGATVSGGSISLAAAAGGTFTNNGALSVAFLQPSGAGSKNLSITALGSATIGADIPVNDSNIAVIYTESQVNTSTFAVELKYFIGDGGTVKVLSAANGVLKVQLTNVVMKADPTQSTGTSNGSFVLSGEATVNGATIH